MINDQGLDSLMLAPSRRAGRRPQPARPHRTGSPASQPTVQVDLADGNQASAGDLIITRRNDRRLASRPRLGPQR